jgi:outer membrane lipoprotein SlyB
MKTKTLATLIFAGTALIGGCASPDPFYDRYGYDNNRGYRYDNSGTRYAESAPRYNGTRSYEGYYGVVDSIESPRRGGSDNAIAGTIIGGVVGGVIGHQIGSGTGNTVATVAGAVGGAAVGHEIGENSDRDLYRVRVRFENGSYQTVSQADIGRLRVGDSVRIENGRAFRY